MKKRVDCWVSVVCVALTTYFTETYQHIKLAVT